MEAGPLITAQSQSLHFDGLCRHGFSFPIRLKWGRAVIATYRRRWVSRSPKHFSGFPHRSFKRRIYLFKLCVEPPFSVDALRSVFFWTPLT
jgi:hypothetical protein